MAQVITASPFLFLCFHYSIFWEIMLYMIKMYLSWPPWRVSGNAPGERLFYSELTPFKNSVMLTDAVGQDLPVAGFKGIAVVMFQTMPFWSTARPPHVRLPLTLFLAVNVPGANRKTISRLSLPMVFSPLGLTGASVTGATYPPPRPIEPFATSCGLFLEPLGLPIIALPLGYFLWACLPDLLIIAYWQGLSNQNICSSGGDMIKM